MKGVTTASTMPCCCLRLVGMMFMAGGGDLITIYLGLELMSLSTYVLVGFIRRDVTSIEGAVKYFLMGAFTSGILLYGLALLYGLTGTTNLSAVAQKLSTLSLDDPALHSGCDSDRHGFRVQDCCRALSHVGA